MPTVAGIDGCRGGWLCLLRDMQTGAVHHAVLPHIAGLLQLFPIPDVVAIDIPIGLPDTGSRDCDLAARERLGPPRASSVFPAPIRPILNATTHDSACAIGHAADGRGLSIQAWCILPKIKEVDAFMQSNGGKQGWIREVHPEVSFCYMNGGIAMTHKKSRHAGRNERMTLLMQHFGASMFNAIPLRVSGIYATDDLLDAFAALWSAERIFDGQAVTLPPNPLVDGTGLWMEIVA